MSDFDEAINRIHEKLKNIHNIKKCRSCECLLDVLDALQGDLQNSESPTAKVVREDMLLWFKEGNQNRHPCLGCEICLPIEPYNEFGKLSREKLLLNNSLDTSQTIPCDCGGT